MLTGDVLRKESCVKLQLFASYTMILKGEKVTNNYNYEFEYVEENQETIESIA